MALAALGDGWWSPQAHSSGNPQRRECSPRRRQAWLEHPEDSAQQSGEKLRQPEQMQEQSSSLKEEEDDPELGEKLALYDLLGELNNESATQESVAKEGKGRAAKEQQLLGSEESSQERELGTVEKFASKRGFGLIKPDRGGHLVFAHWTQICSYDKWPQLATGMRVEYIPTEERGRIVANSITQPSGGIIVSPQEMAKNTRKLSPFTLTGTVDFFHKAGYGFIKLDTEMEWPQRMRAGSEIYVSREEIVMAEGGHSFLEPGQKVQFKVFKPSDKPVAAAEVTAVGGEPIRNVPSFGRHGQGGQWGQGQWGQSHQSQSSQSSHWSQGNSQSSIQGGFGDRSRMGPGAEQSSPSAGSKRVRQSKWDVQEVEGSHDRSDAPGRPLKRAKVEGAEGSGPWHQKMASFASQQEGVQQGLQGFQGFQHGFREGQLRASQASPRVRKFFAEEDEELMEEAFSGIGGEETWGQQPQQRQQSNKEAAQMAGMSSMAGLAGLGGLGMMGMGGMGMMGMMNSMAGWNPWATGVEVQGDEQTEAVRKFMRQFVGQEQEHSGGQEALQQQQQQQQQAHAFGAQISQVPCKFFAQGRCAKGPSCPFSHEIGEASSADRDENGDPTTRKKVPCRFFAAGRCRKMDACPFAHDVAELTPVPMEKKVPVECEFFAQGRCTRGAACPFAHGPQELHEVTMLGARGRRGD